MDDILILGSGKHAAVVIDAIQEQGTYTIKGVIAPNQQTVMGLPNLGTDNDLRLFVGDWFVVAIGDNKLRQAAYERAIKAGLKPATVIHSRAWVSKYAKIGAGCVIMAGAIIQTRAVVGENCIINTGATIDHDNVIGDHAHVAPGAHLAGTVHVGAGALIGTGAVVLPEIEIGAGAIVAAGSVAHRAIVEKQTHIQPRQRLPHRVLIYAPVIGRGGIRRLVERLTRAWSETADSKQWAFHMLGQTADEYGHAFYLPTAVEVTQIEPGAAPLHPRLFDYLTRNQEVFYQHLKRIAGDYDLIWLPHPWWTMQTSRWEIPTPVIATIPDFAFDQLQISGEPANRFRGEARRFEQYANLILFPSDYQRTWGESHYGFHHTATIHYADFLPLHFIPTAQEAERVRIKYKLPERWVLAFHCAHHKDPITILRAQVEARKQSADIPPLVMAGIDTHLYRPGTQSPNGAQHVKATMQACGYQYGHDLFILGEVPDADIAGLYAGAAMAVTASRSEAGLSGTLYEAFAAGTPLVYSSLPAFTERMGENGTYGLAFPIGDYRAMAKAMCQVMEQPEQTQKRIEQGKTFVAQRTWSDVAAEYLAAFERVL